MARTTEKQFYAVVQRLEDCMGIELTTNRWHRHCSVYTKGERDSCQKQLACGVSMRECVEQMWAALNVLSVMKKGDDQ